MKVIERFQSQDTVVYLKAINLFKVKLKTLALEMVLDSISIALAIHKQPVSVKLFGLTFRNL